MRLSRSLIIRLQRGFTLIELMVVIVVIGILLGVVIATRSGVAQKERNTERQRDIGEIRDILEASYAQNDRYPLLSNLNNPKWRNTNMKGLDPEVLRDPARNSSDKLAAKPGKNIYAYTVTSADGGICDNKKVLCTQYTLTATLEDGGPYVKNNLN